MDEVRWPCAAGAPDGIDGGGMLQDHDERCAADLGNVVDGRDLSRDAAGWLARAVTGAIRPNRDKPLWDLAHALAALARLTDAENGRDLVDLVLDPGLAGTGALQHRFGGASGEGASTDASGFVLDLGPRSWRATWSGTGRLLALAEFLLTADDLAGFGPITGWIHELVADPSATSVDLLVSRLTRALHAYRRSHLPLSLHERRFRGILDFLATRRTGRDRTAFTDDDILDFWRTGTVDGDGPSFRTAAEHFVTFEAVVTALGGLTGLRAAASLDATEGWDERIDASLADVVGTEPAAKLAEMLAALPDGPKILTGAERDELADLLRLEPFHRTRPLTTVRAVSFGRVQSGIANRLRRGSGGADIVERVACTDAETYRAISERARTLAAHLGRMVGIAACLRLSPETTDVRVAAALQAGEADLKRVRRAGFDADRPNLAAAFAAVDETLVRIADETSALIRALDALEARRPLSGTFEADRLAFAEAFGRVYLGERVA